MDARLYEQMWRTEKDHWWFVGRRHIVGSLVNHYTGLTVRPRPLRVCELGCGTGGNLEEWADAHDVVGVDASEEALRFARRRLGNRVQLGCLPHAIGLPEDHFDVVLSTDVFEHVEQDREAVEAAVKLLRVGGILVATVPAYPFLYTIRDQEHHHFRRYSRQRFSSLFRLRGVKLELLSYYNTALFPPAALSRLLLRCFPHRASQDDLRIPRGSVNHLLLRVFSAESSVLTRFRLPFGLSLIAVARRISPSSARIAA